MKVIFLIYHKGNFENFSPAHLDKVVGFKFRKNNERFTTNRSNPQRFSIKNAFLKISQYSQEKTCVGVSLILTKLQAWMPDDDDNGDDDELL